MPLFIANCTMYCRWTSTSEAVDIQYIEDICEKRSDEYMRTCRSSEQRRKVALKSIVDQVRKGGSMMLCGGVVLQRWDWKSGIRIILWHPLVYHGMLLS